MTQIDPHENARRLALLSKSRKILNDEYFTRRAEIHAKWQLESNLAWRNNGVLLPYPSSFTLPTENDVIQRALELYNQEQNPDLKQPEIVKTTEPSIQDQLNRISEIKKIEIPQSPTTNPWQEFLLKTAEPPKPKVTVVEPPAPEPTIEEKEEQSTLRSLLSKFVTMATELDKKAAIDKELK
jgi:hypothetical protein